MPTQPTPMVSMSQLTIDGSRLIIDSFAVVNNPTMYHSMYHSIVGALQYITLNYPKLSFSVNFLFHSLSYGHLTFLLPSDSNLDDRNSTSNIYVGHGHS